MLLSVSTGNVWKEWCVRPRVTSSVRTTEGGRRGGEEAWGGGEGAENTINEYAGRFA